MGLFTGQHVMNDPEPRISSELVPEVFDLASRLQAEHNQNYSLSDLVTIGTQANISPEFIQQAVQQVQTQQRQNRDRRQKLKVGMITAGAALALWSLWSGAVPIAQGHCGSRMSRTQEVTGDYGS